ncbi:hypothetical protein SE17_10345 [Kouleothrix aurantiaca]|uniref:Uncharacterized protein n=1 Tax=Kouleothrix aurantiaca TaxID=186479 RepID=A0A0N8PSP7_9CHLR|nr:hypothetical protein SE17_10345 [Kouleothrix aurantiaca]
MDAFKRLFQNCPVCENRGLICVGDDDQDFPCPRCNCWCSVCLEQPRGEQSPNIGALLAAVRRAGDDLECFEGYLCDEHKQFVGVYWY